MSLANGYNLKSPGVKRLMREACELAEPTEEYFARPLDDNLFEWHFTVRGPPNTEFEGGFYHGRILMPSQYPMQPPNIILLTPNGRFEVNKKICLSISGHHPESWQPSWSIRTALLALIAFMPTPGAGTIGSLDYTPEERQVLAKKSKKWECSVCGTICNNLSAQAKVTRILTQEETSLLQQIALKTDDEAKKNTDETPADTKETNNEAVEPNVRHRIAPIQVGPSSGPTSASERVVTQVNVSRNPNSLGNILNTVMWIILCAIGLLVVRRCFFL